MCAWLEDVLQSGRRMSRQVEDLLWWLMSAQWSFRTLNCDVAQPGMVTKESEDYLVRIMAGTEGRRVSTH